MANKNSLPGPIPILMIVIILTAISTWLLPTGQYMAMVNISLKTWVKFIMPMLIAFTIVAMVALVIGIYL